MKYAAIICCALLILCQNGQGQGFNNLGFEQATVASAPANYTPTDAYNPISAASAFPYWTVMEDGVVCNAVWGSPVALDETSVALVSAGYSPIQGNYSIQLTAYADAPSGYYHNSSISQAAQIPSGMQSIQFLIANPSQAGSVLANPIVTINGTSISLFVLSQAGGVTTMGGDVSAFAGTTVDLAFLCQATQGATFPANENMFNLDGIQFSTSSVPEPSAISFMVLGGSLMAFKIRKRWAGRQTYNNSKAETIG